MEEHLRLLRQTTTLFSNLTEAMEEKKLFLDAQLNLEKLAHLLGTNRTQLSYTINDHFGMNFSRWLANYRVEYLKKELQSNPDQSPQDLFHKAGFTSRTSFYRQFKLITGMTPREFVIKIKS